MATDNIPQIAFTVTGSPGSQVASAVTFSGPVPNGKYIIEVGVNAGSNSEYVAVITPAGVAEEANFQKGDL
jgi:hypothetical protein